MTNLEKLKSDDIKTVIEVVEKCVFEAIGGGFDGDHDCYDRNCPYLEDGWKYEDSWVNGMCLKEDSICPFNIDRDKVIRRLITEWLNKEDSSD